LIVVALVAATAHTAVRSEDSPRAPVAKVERVVDGDT
jgi:hypothetical protein